MERRNIFKLTGLAAAIMFSTGTLAASDPQQQSQSGAQPMASQKLPKFEELDHNGDGKLTTDEVGDEAALTAQWTEIDKDDSDTLDRAEFSAFEEERQQRDMGAQQQSQSMQQGEQQQSAQQQEGQQPQGSKEMAGAQLPEFDKLDKDRNGKLTPDEVSEEAAVVTQWTEIDKDDSDTLDRSEFSAFEESYRSEQEQQQKQESGKEGAATQSGAAAGATVAAGSKEMQARGEINHPLYSMSPDELQGQEVMGANGEKLGTVSKVVSDRSSGRIHVVVSGGGFLGIASRENAFPLDDLQMQEGVLQAPVSKQELESRSEYTEDAYVEVQPEDRPISEFSAFEEPATEDDSLRNPTEGQSDEPRSSQ